MYRRAVEDLLTEQEPVERARLHDRLEEFWHREPHVAATAGDQNPAKFRRTGRRIRSKQADTQERALIATGNPPLRESAEARIAHHRNRLGPGHVARKRELLQGQPQNAPPTLVAANAASPAPRRPTTRTANAGPHITNRLAGL